MLAGDADLCLDAAFGPLTPLSVPNLPLRRFDPPGNVTEQIHSQQGYDNTNIVSSAEYPATTTDVQQHEVEEETLWRSAVRLSLKPQEESMLQAFVTHISQWIDLFDPYQHFSSLVPRLALHNVGLLNAILALAIRHNSLGSQPAFARDDALQYYHETLQYVRKAMQYTSYYTSLELLATTLMISAYEMLDGSSSRDWERHLQGVFWIQRSQVIHGDSGGLRAAVWWAWLCQDVWAAFRDKRKVFTFWEPQKTLHELNPTQVASRAVFILGRVINYCAESEAGDPTSNFVSRLKNAEVLSDMLDQWEANLSPEFQPLPSSLQIAGSVFTPVWIHPPMYAVSVQVYHASRILVLLHRPSLGGLSQNLKTQASLDNHVDTICGIALILSDYASSTMSSQCLFIGESPWKALSQPLMETCSCSGYS